VILKSSDSGKNWKSIQVPEFSDMTLNPKSKNEILIATDAGLKLSTDFAKSFVEIGNLENSSKVEWNQDFIFVSDSNSLFRGVDPSGNFEKVDYVFNSISDINSENNIVVVLDEVGVHVSFDSGNYFSMLARFN
jgi:hypothetical protein